MERAQVIDPGGRSGRGLDAAHPGPHSTLWEGYDPNSGTWSLRSPGGIILAAIQAGNYHNAAATAAGVSAYTLSAWRSRARAALAAEDVDPADLSSFDTAKMDEPGRMYVRFLADMTRREGVAEAELVTVWRAQAAEDWRAARDLLSRRYPERWSERHRVEVAGDASAPVTVRVAGLDVDSILAEAVAERDAVPEATPTPEPPAHPDAVADSERAPLGVGDVAAVLDAAAESLG